MRLKNDRRWRPSHLVYLSVWWGDRALDCSSFVGWLRSPAPRQIVGAWIIAISLLSCLGCGGRQSPAVVKASHTIADPDWEPFEKLSDYGIFIGNGRSQEPADGTVPYDLNSALFSDYATKHRFVRLPAGRKALYSETETFEFPVGSVIVKTFGYLHDLRDPSKGERLIETRLLIHRPEGWIGLPYVWNDAQDEAVLDVAGGTVDVSWTHTDGRARTNNYIIPNANQCKGCHENDKIMAPIGPKARHLNKDFAYDSGTENQLVHWTKIGVLDGAPAPEQAPKLVRWDDGSATLDDRARAWLEINCAHCHNPKGPARTSGLFLMASEIDPYKRGVRKTPVAAGRGSGGRLYDILPGKPDESIFMFRLESTDPGVMMPELPRRLVDEEGTALIRQWIAAMPPTHARPPVR